MSKQAEAGMTPVDPSQQPPPMYYPTQGQPSGAPPPGSYPPPQPGSYQPPPPPPGSVAYQGGQTVVVTQPQGFQGKPRYGRDPQQMKCMYCNHDIVTSTNFKVGMMNWMVCGGICLAGLGFPLLWLGCQFIPMCISSLKDVEHVCPNCQKLIGVSERAS